MRKNLVTNLQLIAALLLLSITLCYSVPSLQLKTGSDSEEDINKGFRKQFPRIPEPKFRLPTAVIPSHYDLILQPILDEEPEAGTRWTAPGKVTILVDCIQTTSSITLHTNVRSIDESSVKVTIQGTTDEIPQGIPEYDHEKQFFIINLSTPLQVNGKYSIYIEYIAPIFTDRLDGLYRTQYTNPEGETKYVATTQFQAFGARSAFPCFDEPGLKATFNITIGHNENYNCIANTPIIDTQPIEGLAGWQWQVYEKTVPMSSYLVALVISDFTATAASLDIYPKPVQTVAPKHFIDRGDGVYAAKIVAMDLAFFEDFFQTEYSLGKMDSAAVVDFAGGAMENWGLNIYRESTLLYNAEENTEDERRTISRVIAHEISHQWFGNIITCKWWIDAWLNEGFATYLQFTGLQHTDEEYDGLKALLNDALQVAMRYDVMDNSHPTVLPDKGSPYDTMTYSTQLVYQKGGALIRMMEGFLTLPTLQATEQDDLFQVLTEQAHLDNALHPSVTIKDIMDTWTLQKGYPLVRVTTAGASRIYISQERFQNFNSRNKQLDPNNLWYIPVAVATQSDPDFTTAVPKLWIEQNVALTSAVHNTSEWVVINAGATGYYRVLYNNPLTALLQKQFLDDHTVIHLGSRSQIMDDYFNFGFQHYNPIEPALEFTKYLSEEVEYTVWNPVLTHLRKVYTLYSGVDTFQLLINYLGPRIDGVLQKIGIEQDSDDKGVKVIFRSQLLDWACGMSHPGCQAYATRLFNEWKDDPTKNPIPLDIRPVVYCSAIRTGDETNFDFAFDKYTTTTFAKEKSWILASLGCASDTNILQKFLDRTLDPASEIRKIDFTAAVQSVARNSYGWSLVLQFLDTRLDDILSYTENPRVISSVISTLSTYFSTTGDLRAVETFVENNSDKLDDVIKPALQTALKTIQDNILWVNTFGNSIVSWFGENSNS